MRDFIPTIKRQTRTASGALFHEDVSGGLGHEKQRLRAGSKGGVWPYAGTRLRCARRVEHAGWRSHRGVEAGGLALASNQVDESLQGRRPHPRSRRRRISSWRIPRGQPPESALEDCASRTPVARHLRRREEPGQSHRRDSTVPGETIRRIHASCPRSTGSAMRLKVPPAETPADNRTSHTAVRFRLLWANGRAWLGEGEHLLGRDPDLTSSSIPLVSPGGTHGFGLPETKRRSKISGSKNGTFVADWRLDFLTRLVDGDRIGVGSLQLTFNAIRTSASTRTEPHREG